MNIKLAKRSLHKHGKMKVLLGVNEHGQGNPVDAIQYTSNAET